ncbi:MAG: sodium:calcium antiporter [Brevinema sp.]
MEFIWNNFIMLLGMIAFLTLIIFWIGDRLAFYADQLSIVTRISGAFIGFVLIAMITSIPEMVSAVVAAHQGSLGLAVGGVLGSNAINIAILSIILIVFKDKIITVTNTSIFSFLGSLILLSVVGIVISIYPISQVIPNKYLIGLVMGIIYFFIMRHAYDLNIDTQEETRTTPNSFIKIVSIFVFFAFSIIMLAWVLVLICKHMATVPVPIYGKPLGEHFIGTLILAFSTSIPELATTFQIVRRGITNMAIENIAGSNIFNLLALVIASFFYKDSFWAELPLNSLYTLFIIFILSLLICIVGLIKESRRFTYGVYVMIVIIWLYSLALVF